MNRSNAWSVIGHLISPKLSPEDDPAAWEAMVTSIYSDAELLLQGVGRSVAVVTEIGCCSKWLRPHQTRWTADGGFAWPSGYGGRGYSRSGLPEFDWSIEAEWDVDGLVWRPVPEGRSTDARALRLRVAVPGRTVRHEQAAVHTRWSPGPPQHRRRELVQFYGFRKHTSSWAATAYMARPDEKAYDKVAPAV